MFKACAHREWLLVKKNLFVYVFKAVQVSYYLRASTDRGRENAISV